MSAPRDVVELLQELVRIPSVNPHGEPGTSRTGEGECAQFIGEVLRECCAEVEFQEVKPGRPNVIGRFPSDRAGKKRIVLAPHTDTVSVAGMTIDPFGGERREGRVYGRGASDTKGTIAAMLCALKEMGDGISALDHEIWFAGLMSEESGQDGSRAFVREHQADFALIGEPTELQIVNTHKGSTWLSLTTRGVAAHSSTPERGENAIYKMADVARFIRDEVAPGLGLVVDPTLGSPTVSAGVISGGSKINIVPDACRMEVDVRTVPALYATGFPGSITDRLRSVCPDLEIETWEARPLFTDPSHPLIGAMEALGAKCVSAPWFCDAAVFGEAGIPAVAAGPGSIAQAHTKDEWVSEQALRDGVEFYRKFLERC